MEAEKHNQSNVSYLPFLVPFLPIQLSTGVLDDILQNLIMAIATEQPNKRKADSIGRSIVREK